MVNAIANYNNKAFNINATSKGKPTWDSPSKNAVTKHLRPDGDSSHTTGLVGGTIVWGGCIKCKEINSSGGPIGEMTEHSCL